MSATQRLASEPVSDWERRWPGGRWRVAWLTECGPVSRTAVPLTVAGQRRSRTDFPRPPPSATVREIRTQRPDSAANRCDTATCRTGRRPRSGRSETIGRDRGRALARGHVARVGAGRRGRRAARVEPASTSCSSSRSRGSSSSAYGLSGPFAARSRSSSALGVVFAVLRVVLIALTTHGGLDVLFTTPELHDARLPRWLHRRRLDRAPRSCCRPPTRVSSSSASSRCSPRSTRWSRTTSSCSPRRARSTRSG